ncbi:hypothetical protein ACJJTC_003901 [Scirpophaga incertulas]
MARLPPGGMGRAAHGATLQQMVWEWGSPPFNPEFYRYNLLQISMKANSKNPLQNSHPLPNVQWRLPPVHSKSQRQCMTTCTHKQEGMQADRCAAADPNKMNQGCAWRGKLNPRHCLTPTTYFYHSIFAGPLSHHRPEITRFHYGFGED